MLKTENGILIELNAVLVENKTVAKAPQIPPF